MMLSNNPASPERNERKSGIRGKVIFMIFQYLHAWMRCCTKSEEISDNFSYERGRVAADCSDWGELVSGLGIFVQKGEGCKRHLIV